MSKYNEILNKLRILSKSSDIDERYGPWESVSQANQNIPLKVREPGLTVGIYTSNNTVTEYWYNGGTFSTNLVIKSPGNESNFLNQDITANFALGGIEDQELISSGLTFTQFVEKLLTGNNNTESFLEINDNGDGTLTFTYIDSTTFTTPSLIGPKGDKGDTGDKGDKGDVPAHQWNDKYLSFQNPNGSYGLAMNLEGPEGPRGLQGDKGDQGDTGNIGPKGDTGERGIQGIQGEIPSHNWIGTALQWENPDGSNGLATELKGERGFKGDTGDIGPKGDTGERGIQGIQGVQGIEGEKGERGLAPSHTWVGTSLKWENPDGSDGLLVDLKGDKGDKGDDGTVVDTSNLVTINGNETITGEKTFTSNSIFNGNVGIGTNSPSSSGKLDVNGATLFRTTDNWNVGPNVLRVNGFGMLGNRNSIFLTNQNPTGNIKFGVGGVHGAASEKMILTSTGNLGIGTNTPSAKLDVNGNSILDHLKLGELKNVGNNSVRYFKIGYFTLPNQYMDGQAIVEVLTRNGGNHTVHVNIERGSNQIDSIKTFFIKGNTHAETYYLYRTSANVAELWVKSTQSYDSLQIAIRNHSSDFTPDVSSGQANAPANEASWSAEGYFFNDGNLGIGTDTPSAKLHVNGNIKATKFYQTSLRDFKTNIKDYKKGCLDLIGSLNIVEFDYKDGGENNIGIIADDSPIEFLSEEKDSVNLYNTLFIQAKAIQELNSKVSNQEDKINSLQNQINELKKLITNG